MEVVMTMYMTLMPAIIAGILTMVWCKLPILPSLNKPIDGGIHLWDGRRLFGDNKTWKGLLGYLIMNVMTALLWGGIIGKSARLLQHNYFYKNMQNHLPYNLLLGILLGLGYALFELPNSFLKRRLDIVPGKTDSGLRKIFFVFMDQADSVVGCALVVWLFYDIGWGIFLLFIVVGAGTHILINILLYFLHLRKNMF